jgi:hypothetical protein
MAFWGIGPSTVGKFAATVALVGVSLGMAAAVHARPLSSCGDGFVDSGEDCDSGSAEGSPDCDTACRRTVFEPPGLPFGEISSSEGELPWDLPRIYSPRLSCKPHGARKDARLGSPARVRYRIHLCRNALGLDSFTTTQVRSALANAAAEYAKAGIVLEEESLARFDDDDCIFDLGQSAWTNALAADTPDGVLALTFVTGITANAQFNVGGFCYFFGPICVNAGVYDSVVIHELGHFFGLAHTFECANGIESEANCSEAGDLICDTPPDHGPSGFNGIARCDDGSLLSGSCKGSCGAKLCTDGSQPDGYNWMSYYHCQPGRLSDEQRDFIRCTLDNELKAYNADAPSDTTTTTLPITICGDVNEDGTITASDALAVLRAGVGSTDCDPSVCDYDGSGKVTVTDALAVLRAAIGDAGNGNCPL